MQENNKEIVIKKTVRNAFGTEPIYQYDTGHVLSFDDGFDLPEFFEVHFSQSIMGESITQIGQNHVVTLPDMYAQTAQTIFAWLYINDGESGLTKFAIEIPVYRKAKPSDDEPTPVEERAIDQAIAALNEGVERSETAADNAEAYATSAENANDSAEASADLATEKATEAAGSALEAQTAALEADRSADDASDSAQLASQKAAEADASATAAAESAEDLDEAVQTAQGAANTATAKATEASQSATLAGQKATEAGQSATSAGQSAATAVNAKTDAVSAKERAVEAETNAEASAASASETKDAIDDEVTGFQAQIDDLDDTVTGVLRALNQKPDIENTDAEDVDLDISDESGNVVARFEDGSIKVKDFNSSTVGNPADLETNEKDTLVSAINEVNALAENTLSEIDAFPAVRDTQEEDVDLDIADASGNSLARFENGHIKTKNFDSSHVSTAVDSVHATSDDDLVVSDAGGNVLMALKGGNIKTKRFNSLVVNPNVVTVKANGGGDYTSLRSAIESIADADAINNPYVIEIYEGTYNILDDYTQAEIENADFVGLMLSDGMYLKGIGNRDNIVVYGYLDPETYTNDTRNRIATLNTKSECGMENLTVIGEKIRYAVHDDYQDSFRINHGRNPVRSLKNCVFIGKQTTGTASYGAGTSNARDYIIENCLFPTERIGIHMQEGMAHSGQMIVTNCSGVGFSIGDYSTSASSPKHTLVMNGCCFKSVDIYKARNGSYNAQHMRVFGTGNRNAFINAPNGFVYQTGDVETTSTAITLGKVVTADYSTATAGTAYGVSLGIFEGLSYIQRSGYILASLLGLSVSAGEYVGVSDWNVDVVSTQADSIGKVVAFNNKAYIKLTI